MQSYDQSNHIARWGELLHKAVTEPGVISTAYRRFHNYSFGNQLLALVQCERRGIEPGPLATYPRWKELVTCPPESVRDEVRFRTKERGSE